MNKALNRPLPSSNERWYIHGWLPDNQRTLALVLCIIVGAQNISQLRSHAIFDIIASATLYLAGLLAIFLVQSSPDRRRIIAGSALTLGLACVIARGFSGALGALLINILAFFLVFRLPRSWSLPLVGALVTSFACVLLIAVVPATNTSSADTAFWSSLVWSMLWSLPLLTALASVLRSRVEVLQQLQTTQKQLRAELERTAELATTAERMRIARDMHDVLAHSLTMLAVQTQATREIVLRQPERAAQMLDVMIQVLGESTAESRRAIGALREAPQAVGGSSVSEQLRSLAHRFALRTGMTCTLTETGEPGAINEAQTAALLYALQEALTNAHRHGAARHVSAELAWEHAEAILTVIDDGTPSNVAHTPPLGGGNGLRGMHERVCEVGGSVSAGPGTAGGFVVRITLPLGVLARMAG